jgi:hypothetical protein
MGTAAPKARRTRQTRFVMTQDQENQELSVELGANAQM